MVDWLGLDAYNTGPYLDWGTPRWRSFREVMSTPYTALTAIANKPVLLAEVGSSENGGSKADWITSALTTELPMFPRVGALVWFDIAKEDAWGLHSSPAAFAAWTSAASLPQFRLSSWSPVANPRGLHRRWKFYGCAAEGASRRSIRGQVDEGAQRGTAEAPVRRGGHGVDVRVEVVEVQHRDQARVVRAATGPAAVSQLVWYSGVPLTPISLMIIGLPSGASRR